LQATGTTISATEGNLFVGTVATFTDSNGSGSASDFSATISWGDGSSSPGTISANQSGGFDVSGSHTYTIEGDLAFSVAIIDKGGSAVAVAGIANVADAQLAATGVSLTESKKVAFSAVIATFTDANLLSDASDFTAVICWGDGSNSNGTIMQNARGSFCVWDSHTYMQAGTFTITVQIFDVGLATTTAESIVIVLNGHRHGQNGTALDASGANGSIWDVQGLDYLSSPG
jgi:hypothetical protein